MKRSIFVMELVVALLIVSSVYAQSDKQDIKESHFGIHLGDSHRGYYHMLHPYIRELGNIYVRNEIWGDLYGWKKVKNGSSSIFAGKELCEKCCDPKRSSSGPKNPQPKSCYCENGQFYFCRPYSREGLIEGMLVAEFYENPENLPFGWFVSVLTSRYDKRPPKNFPAGAYPYGNEDTYREYIEYLVKRLGGKAKYWQIGNENDYPKFWAGNPKEYAKMLEIASKVIRDNCKDCKVGISFASLDLKRDKNGNMWFEAMQYVRDAFDFIDSHYYIPRLIEPDALDEWKKACPGKEFILV